MKLSIKAYLTIITIASTTINMCFGVDSKILFSQYTETESGTSPKGYEIWNPSGGDINLSAEPITIRYSANTNITLGNVVTINTGIFKAGDVIVVGRSEIGDYLTASGLCEVRYINKQYTFNGNDYLQLELDGNIQDVIGVNGSSTAWTNNGVSTADQNIQLKSGITTGYITPPTSYDPSAHFTTIGVGSNLSGFGIPPVISTATSLPRVSNVSIISATLIEITFSEPMTQSNPAGNVTGLGAIHSYSWETSTLLSITLAAAISYGSHYEISIDNFEDLNTGAMCSAFLHPFVLNPITKGLVISEIMYNPPESGTDTLEFIEIYNNTNSPIALGGLKLSEAVDYTFPLGSFIDARGAIAVAGNLRSANLVYGPVFIGEFSGTLANAGETINLRNTNNTIVCTALYDNVGDWPNEAEGKGSSLELRKANLSTTIPYAYRPSFSYKGKIGGKPLFASPGVVHFNLSPQALLTFKDSVFHVTESDSINIPIFMRYNSSYNVSFELEITGKTATSSDYKLETTKGILLASSPTTNILFKAMEDAVEDNLEYVDITFSENNFARIGGFSNCRIYIHDSVKTSTPTTNHSICFNELMLKNESYLLNNGQYMPWLEFYNSADSAINIKNWHLAYDKNQETDTLLLSTDTVLAPKSYYLLFLDSSNFILPTQFADLFLLNNNKELIAKANYRFTKIDESEGTLTDCNEDLSRMDYPTPGYDNNSPVGIIKKEKHLTTISLHPQPAQDYVIITYPGTNNSVEIFDLAGRKVISLQGDMNKGLRINTDELNSGIYVVLLNNKKGKKLIIK